MNRLFVSLFVLVMPVLLPACRNEWDAHNRITDAAVAENLFERINQDTSLSGFSALLVKTGYDTVLAASQVYTVWAPDNAALRQVNAALLNDADSLKLFVAGHIGRQAHLTTEPQPSLRVGTLAGKYHLFTATGFGGAGIVTPNLYANNGILHIIDSPVLLRKSVWEYVVGSGAGVAQYDYLWSLNYEGLDTLTGEPVVKNVYLDSVADVGDESKEHTFFVLTDAAYASALGQLEPFYATGTADSTLALASWALVKDLAVAGAYGPDDLPDTLVSVTGISIPVDKGSIVASYHASNGWVYVLNGPATPVELKFPPLVVQGELPVAFSRTDKAADIFYRIKSDDAGFVFRDIEVYGHATPLFYIQYQLAGVPSGKYRVYWRAVAGNGDAQTVSFQQQVSFGQWDAGSLPYTTVVLNDYQDVYLGDYMTGSYGTLDIFLVAANSSTAGVNTLSLDYLKLVPVF